MENRLLDILKLNNIITHICNYETINKLSNTKMRNIKNGITLNDALLYKFMYAQQEITKESAVAYINNYNKENDLNKNNFNRKAFESKENNIPLQLYELIAENIIKLYNDIVKMNNNIYKKENDTKNGDVIDNNIIGNKNDAITDNFTIVAVDGSSTNNNKQKVMLNMCKYDIEHKVPLDLTCNGPENRNKEVEMLIKDIIDNPNKYENIILIGDRLYFTYKLMHLMHQKHIKFIIRAKGDADNLEPDKELSKNMKDYDKICELRNNIRIIRCKNKYKKTVFSAQRKKADKKTYNIDVTNDCVLITNLCDTNKYTDDHILKLYRSRWEVEIYFKLLKANMKFQFMKESSTEQYNRLYICELIITYILRLIEYLYIKQNKINTTITKKIKRKIVTISVKINDSLLINGIFKSLLYDFLHAQLTEKKIYNFCSSYIKIIKNTTDRKFPRTSKKPFSKWYLKGYSAQTKLIKILQAISNDELNQLDKNSKLIAKKIKITKVIT